MSDVQALGLFAKGVPRFNTCPTRTSVTELDAERLTKHQQGGDSSLLAILIQSRHFDPSGAKCVVRNCSYRGISDSMRSD